jgi:hypothetical protein
MLMMLALMLQAAAPPAEIELTEGDLHQMSMIAGSRQAAGAEQARKLKGRQLAAALTGALENKTRLIYKKGLGIIVEYTAPGGELRMWYPGEKDVIAGQWGVQQKKKLASACFRFGAARSAAPALFEPKECFAAEQTLGAANVIRDWRGDVFNLMSGRIPYVKSAMGMPTP